MDGDAEPFKQLLAPNFELHFSKNNVVNTLAQFEKWGVKLKALTVHKWIVQDDINAPFAKIQKMEVSYKIPFSPLDEK